MDKILVNEKTAEIIDAVKKVFGVDISGFEIKEDGYVFKCADGGPDILIPFSSLKEGFDYEN